MKIFAITLAVMLATISPSSAKAEDAHAFLQNILRVYGDCSSLYCEGTITSTVRFVGGGSVRKGEPDIEVSEFRAWYKRPFLFRMDWAERNPMVGDDTAWSLYREKDGQYVIDYPFRRPEGQIRHSERHRTLDEAIERSRRASADLTYFIPKLMENKSTWFDINDCELQGEELVNGKVCRILSLHNSRMGDWALWADKKTFAIYRIQQGGFLPDSALESYTRHMETNPERESPDDELDDGGVIAPFIMRGRSYTMTVDFTTVVFDKELTEDDFYYTGPKAGDAVK